MSLSRLLRRFSEKNSTINGKAIHAQIILSGRRADVQTDNHLLAMYSKIGCIDYARKVFDQMPERNVVSWTSLISSYSQIGISEEALNCFRSMVLESRIDPNDYTYVAAISACAQMEALACGKEIHGRIYRTGEAVNNFVKNCLVNFYGKCGLLRSARVVFDTIHDPGTVSWVSLMSSYVRCGENEEGLRIFLRSLRMGVGVNEFSYGTVLGTCAALEFLDFGMQVQCLAVKLGVEMDQFVVTNLVHFYGRCGDLELAKRALREANRINVTAWTALIGGCVHLGENAEAISLFRELHCFGLKPNEQTFVSALGALGKEKDVEGGMQLHCSIVKAGFDSFTFVSNSVLDFYAKVDRLDDSFEVFRSMDAREIVSWNALIAGCVNLSRYEAAIMVIRSMFSDGFEPNVYTFSSLLNVCGELPAAAWGKQTHCRVVKPGLDSNIVVGSALVDMYAKCGRLKDARTVFDILPNKNIVSWNTMITAYAQYGSGKEALEIYGAMVTNGVRPNDVTFVGVLSALGHTGDLEGALAHFGSMAKDFGVKPRADHVACIVTLLSRKGRTREAYEFMTNSPVGMNNVVWRSLLSGCVANNDLELGLYAAQKILTIDPNDASARVMLSKVYADSNMWNEASQVRESILGKEAACSWT
ncbi:pentatricopeptide repeat-containing protein At2g27610-like [Andrographis paniculata]|uniref:pentatricopeptide repeat-containing protein At2g27610-like n=1 Tax=Andrographis paniculata TaxID=175694 RepID=UPI0021E6EB15|nr:pentatricopeptide repeat-containing protein At2g27610-like [Andrographis paniculata]